MQSQRRIGRLDTAIATLALAGPEGMTHARYFQAVYGFHFSRTRHSGILDVLVHRMRERLELVGQVLHGGGHIALSVRRSFAVPDPRCSHRLHDRVLLAMAKERGITAKAVAEALDVPLRAAQAALKELVGEGTCNVERRGRRLEYRIEDTTFSESTSAG
jgi:hypothetical protein